MRAIKSLLVMTAVAGLVATMGARSFADILPPFPTWTTPGQWVAGESTLYVRPGDTGEPITVDWIVVFWGNVGPGGKPVWGYYYQLENPQTQPHPSKTISTLTIDTLPPFGPFFDAKFVADTDLDIGFTDDPPYGAVPAHIVFGEFEPTPGNIQNPVGVSRTDFDVTFTFHPPESAEIARGNESTVLVAYSFLPPTYGWASAMNTGVQWKGKVPVPSPEPNVVVLLAMGLMGIGIAQRRRNKKA